MESDRDSDNDRNDYSQDREQRRQQPMGSKRRRNSPSPHDDYMEDKRRRKTRNKNITGAAEYDHDTQDQYQRHDDRLYEEQRKTRFKEPKETEDDRRQNEHYFQNDEDEGIRKSDKRNRNRERMNDDPDITPQGAQKKAKSTKNGNINLRSSRNDGNGSNQQNETKNTIQGNVTGGGPNSQNLNHTNMNQSQNQMNKSYNRAKRERKNLQKYDSNSIDEEEFQDYFSNPQKRKEFDRQRLQQQMREIQNIAGFSLGQYGNKSMKQMKEAFPVQNYDINNQQQNQKNYATVSLCCLSVTNPVRNKIIQLVAINPWFDRIILVVIIVNCFFLAIDKESSISEDISTKIDMVFLIIYTTEMILKIIAMGFFMRAHSYLRDAWNILDFIVVILGWVSALIKAQNVSAIRVMRILRPLRTINSMPGMSGLVSTILNSLPIMFDIGVLFGFLLIMFGTIGTQLLGGHLENRCFAINHKGELSNELGRTKLMVFCLHNHDCVDRVPKLLPDEVILNPVCRPFSNPISDTFNFDNIFMSILNIFQIITLEGWTDMMYIVRDAEQTYAYDVFFILCVLFGAFFVLNLMIAVQFTYLKEAFDEEERRTNEHLEKLKNKKKLKLEHDEDSIFDEDDDEDLSDEEESEAVEAEEDGSNPDNKKSQVDVNGNKIKRKKKSCFKIKKIPVCVAASKKVENIVNTDKFSNMITMFIVFNTIFLACEQYDQPVELTNISNIANLIFTIVFTAEMILKIFGLGIRKYLQDGFNDFDAVVVIMSLVELVQEAEKSGLSVLRAFRLLRVFKIIKSWSSLRILLTTVLQSISAISNLGFLTLLYLFIFSLLAKQFFQGPLLNEDETFSRYSFDTTADSFRTIFIILTGENWNQIMVQVMVQQKAKAFAAIFFSLMMMIGNYMLLNLFLAILLKFISENGEEDGQEDATADEVAKSGDNAESLKINKLPTDMNVELNDSAPLNSSNSNIEEEFEQIKLQLQQFSNMNIDAFNKQQQEELREKKRLERKLKKKDREGANQEDQEEEKQEQEEQDQEDGEPIDFDDIELEQKDQKKKRKKQRNEEYYEDNYEGGRERDVEESYEFSDSQSAPDREKADPNQAASANFKGSIDTLNLKSLAARSVNTSKKKQKKTIQLDENSRSLFILAHDNKVRCFLKNIIENPYFEGFIYHLIAFNSLLLAIDTPSLKDPFQKDTLKSLLFIITWCFIIECILKVIVMGFYFAENAYLKDSWNVLDFIIVFFSVVTMVLEQFSSVSIDFLKGFRALRALRPLRVVSKNEGIKTVVNSLLLSIPSLLNVLLIIILFLLVFGILGVQLFKGGIAFCNDTSKSIKVKQDCVGQYEVMTYDDYGDPTGVMHMTDRIWTVPPNNYNNVFNSMLTFFEISTLEMWPTMMFQAVDSVGYDKVQVIQYNPPVALIYVVFIFLTTFFIMNLFISVIVDKFNEEIKKRQGAHNFTEEQKEWVKIQRLLVHTNPKIIPVEPINCLRLQCFKIVQSQAFEYFIMGAIVINTVFLCIDYVQKGPQLTKILVYANNTFVIVFTFEMILKIVAYGFSYYWHVNWNKFDFIIVIMSLLALDETLLRDLNFNVTALRIIRVSRLLRMVKTSQGLRSLLKTLFLSLGNILQSAALLMLILFTFTVAGMNLFGNLKYGEFITKNANFETFYISLSTLWRACTGESWNGIMQECSEQTGLIATLYWILFQLITFFIFMNVFIAVIYENFSDIQASEDENDILSLKKKDIKAFQSTWAKYNPMGELYMRTLRLPDFLRELPPPLGYQGIRIEDSKLNKIIFCLNIRDHTGKVYYPEVMWTIFHSIVGINDDKVNNCEQIINILKLVKRKYKTGLGKKVNLDSLCGNKYYRNELTAIKYIQAMKILNKWRNYKNMRIKQKEQEMMKKLTIDAKVIENLGEDMHGEQKHHRNSISPKKSNEETKKPPLESENINAKRLENIKKSVKNNREFEERNQIEMQIKKTPTPEPTYRDDQDEVGNFPSSRRGNNDNFQTNSRRGANEENFPSSRRGDNDSYSPRRGGHERSSRKKRYESPLEQDNDEDFSEENAYRNYQQQQRPSNRGHFQQQQMESEDMDDDADPGGLTERDPRSARKTRGVYQNNKIR